MIFQFTPLREGRLIVLVDEAERNLFQFTPLREGRPMASVVINTRFNISIHAPAGGATWDSLGAGIAEGLFQFTPLREGRRAACAPADALHHFNSRPCGRGDLPPVHHGQREKRISIHAPAGGATGDHDKTRLGQDHFNSRPCGRGDAQQSQPTAPKPISIHAPAGGATDLTPFEPIVKLISIHAPAGGATRSGPHGPAPADNFNSRPCGRGDSMPTLEFHFRYLFQFTPLREGRPCIPRSATGVQKFQFTPLREGRLSYNG